MMPQSPNAVSRPPAPDPASPAQDSASGRVAGGASASGPAPARRTSAMHWLQRADFFLGVMVRLYIGLILFFLPWTHLWSFNRFFLYFAAVARFAQNGAVRGIVSGLGLLNLWIAISEAIHYKEG
jgi:hypothetical protein